MNGKTELYLGLVKDFNKEQRTLNQSMLEMFDNQHWETLYRTVHSLKSNAAYIGAFELSKISQQLESALGVDDHDKVLFIQLCETLTPLMAALDKVYPDELTDDEGVSFSVGQLKHMLTQLMPMLESSDFAVENKLPALKQLCANTEFADDVDELIEFVDDIEYEKAVEVAERVLMGLDAR
jgi:two-component system sensor histidine kinase/response regulator